MPNDDFGMMVHPGPSRMKVSVWADQERAQQQCSHTSSCRKGSSAPATLDIEKQLMVVPLKGGEFSRLTPVFALLGTGAHGEDRLQGAAGAGLRRRDVRGCQGESMRPSGRTSLAVV
jgi:hypothetical protein